MSQLGIVLIYLFFARLVGRSPKTYSYDADSLKLIYKAAGGEQKVYMEQRSNGKAIFSGNGKQQWLSNMVCCVQILFCAL